MTTRKEATEALKRFLKSVGLFVLPPSIVAGIITFFFDEDKIYATLSVIITIFILYIIWIEFRLRKIEERI